jgi:ubiquinol-cytochrome c reductase cytochrome b subunit
MTTKTEPTLGGRRSFLGVLLSFIGATTGVLLSVPLFRFAQHPLLAATTETAWSDLGAADEFAELTVPTKRVIKIEQLDGWPLIGEWLKKMMRGGAEMGTLTLSRFYVAHVFLLPAAIFAVVAAHIFLFRKAGAAGPISEDPIHPKLPAERFYPRQVVMDMGFSLLLIAALGVLSYLVPAELGPKADPSDTQYLPRPEWYYIPAFEWLKYWPGSRALIGIVILPLIIVGLFVGLPFLDRRLERRPWKRPVAVGFFLLVFLSLVGLGVLSYRGDHRDPAIAKQLEWQREETEAFMAEKTSGGQTGSHAETTD